MISAKLTGDTARHNRFGKIGRDYRSGIARVVAKIERELHGSVQTTKVSDPVRRAHSGRPRRGSATQMNQRRTSARATVINPANSALAHEYGFAGTVSVRASLGEIKAAFGRSMTTGTIGVGMYQRPVDLPQRPSLRSTLANIKPDIHEAIHQALRVALA